MRGFLIFLGLLLVLTGGALAGAQYAPVDLSVLDSVSGAKEFLTSPMALYAGAGAAGFGLLLIIVGAASGGKKTSRPTKTASADTKSEATKPPKSKPAKSKSSSAETQSAKSEAARAPAQRAPEPATAKPVLQPAGQPAPPAAPQPAPQPVAAAPRPAPAAAQPLAPAPQPAPSPPPPTPAHKPTASAQPPSSAPSPIQDPRLFNRKRVQDLVTINDALKAYHQKHGAYPKAAGLAGFLERGAAWIPGLAPEFLKVLPRDPAMSEDKAGPQYVYASDGVDYKLLAQGVSLVGSTNVEVLGVRIDMTRQPTAENASFGFWTPGFASA